MTNAYNLHYIKPSLMFTCLDAHLVVLTGPEVLSINAKWQNVVLQVLLPLSSF
jgi:hypothetical protein